MDMADSRSESQAARENEHDMLETEAGAVLQRCGHKGSSPSWAARGATQLVERFYALQYIRKWL